MSDAADGSSNLGTENWLLGLATGREWVTGWLNKRRYGFFLMFFLFRGGQNSNKTIFGALINLYDCPSSLHWNTH